MFAHGIWTDGSCFSKVIPPLHAEGYEVMAAQYGLDSNVADVAATRRTLGRFTALLSGRAGRAQKQRDQGRNRWHPSKCSTYLCAVTC